MRTGVGYVWITGGEAGQELAGCSAEGETVMVEVVGLRSL